MRLRLGDPGEQQREFDVLLGGENRKEVVGLEDEPHSLGAELGLLIIRHLSKSGPSTDTLPFEKSSRPDTQLRRVVLPHPEGPMTAIISPLLTARLTPLRASTLTEPVW